MTDRPDWESGIYIVGVGITLPITIEAAEVTLPVNIEASEVTLDINITASDIDINIVFTDQSVAVFDAAAWFAHQAAQVSVEGNATANVNTLTEVIDRVVPTGKVFMVGGMGYGVLDTDGGVYSCFALLDIATVDVMSMYSFKGHALTFNVPFRATAGQHVRVYASHHGTAGSRSLVASFWGYDEDA